MRKAFWIIVAGIFLLILLVGYYADWLWFGSLGYQRVFVTILLTKWIAGVVFGGLLGGIVGGNLYLAWKAGSRHGLPTQASLSGVAAFELPEGWTRGTAGVLIGVLGLAVAVLTGIGAAARWQVFLKYLYAKPFGVVDPIFRRDVGFYVFSLPFLEYIQNWLLTAMWLTIIGILAIYVIDKAVVFVDRILMMPHVHRHLTGLIGVLLLVMSWGYWLKLFKLLYSQRGVAYGASFTDTHIQLPILWFFLALSLVLGVVFLVNIFWVRRGLLMWGTLGFIGMVIVLFLLPSVLVQKFVVEPNELAKEGEYIRYNIDFTRRAYGLDTVREKDFPAANTLTMPDLKRNQLTIQNVRIWDERPLLRTYKQLQEIRLYYDFNSVDVDRYWLDGRYRQVMLSAREIVSEQIPGQANTWVNQTLQYTHGYGLVLSPVNQVTSEGLPELLVKDVPPVSDTTLRITRPEIYFGKRNSSYVIVKTATPEFDYPKGDENRYTVSYGGTGGVAVGSLLRRLTFALKFFDINILLSGYIKPESRILLYRGIRQRVETLAPFLSYDRDPYLVISKRGRLFWVQDAYTTTDRYPYSEPVRDRRLNYIRNSVKVLIDAYNGSVDYYLVDPHDPLARSYAAMFPGLFKPVAQLPEDLRAHLRYPKGLFGIQALMYRSYHMTDVRVFYNQEDLWSVPNEIYSGNRQPMEPYYIIVRLPQTAREEFLLMLPMTPSKKDNMIAWMAARCDVGVYGQLLVYKLPKEKLIFGPMQIEARVDQQPEISSELTLWGQRGSRVIRGNLLVIPIGQSFIYVEPVYLEAQQGQVDQQIPAAGNAGGVRQRAGQAVVASETMGGSASLPELKKVIVAYGNRLAMREDLGSAIQAVFGSAPKVAGIPSLRVSPMAMDASLQELVGAAQRHYDNARKYLKHENWSGFGQEWQALQETLKRLGSQAGGTKAPQP